MPVSEIAEQLTASAAERDVALERFEAVRRESEALTANLTPEDQSIQSMPDVSPTKWHLAHTTWFFETFILTRFDPDYRVFDPGFAYLFNSYYEAAGPRHPRPERGLLSRPAVDVVAAYRDHVGAAMARFAEEAPEDAWCEAAPLIELGGHHEQQHQELILMDIKHVFSINPLLPAYQAPRLHVRGQARMLGWVDFPGGLVEIGHRGSAFSFDNETPCHKVWLEPVRVATRPVSCGEYLGFIEDGGYQKPEFWLSDGWATVCQQGWEAPLYWHHHDGEWSVFTLSGRCRLPKRAEQIGSSIIREPEMNEDTFDRLYAIGGAELALRHAEMSAEVRERRFRIEKLRLFECGGTLPEADDRVFADRFELRLQRGVHRPEIALGVLPEVVLVLEVLRHFGAVRLCRQHVGVAQTKTNAIR